MQANDIELQPELDTLTERLDRYDRCNSYRVQDNGHKVVTHSNEVVDHIRYQKDLLQSIDITECGFAISQVNQIPRKINGEMEQVTLVTLTSIARLRCDW